MTIIDYIIEQLDVCVRRIAPGEQLQYISQMPCNDKDRWISLYDRIFMCDKFLSSHIFPRKWDIKKSSSLNIAGLSSEHLNNYMLLQQLLESGDKQINSLGFLPNSRNRYFVKTKHSEFREYINDFSADFWGIKHFHLNVKKT